MKPNKLISSLHSQLSKPYTFDGRLLVIAALAVYFSVIVMAHLYFGNYVDFWKKIGVPAMEPTFYDLRVITAGLDSFQQGNDPLAVFPKKWQQIETMFNYPRIWYAFSYLGLGEKHTVVAGFLLAVIFYCALFYLLKKLNLAEAIIYSLFLCSPAVMFLVERGNCDIVIFALLCLTIFTSDNKGILGGASYLFFILACLLKLYPIFSITFFFKHRPARFFITSAVIGICFLLYIFMIGDELSLISKATPRGTSRAFGAFVFADNYFINDTEVINATNRAISKIADATLDRATIQNIKHSHKVIIALLALSAILIFITARSKPLQNAMDMTRIDSFRIGASIYLGIYMLGNNWDYRLTFLIFTLPQLINWCKTSNPFSYLSFAAIAGILVSSWNQIVWKVIKHIFKLKHHYFIALGLEEFINYLLFLYFLYVLIQTLPEWAKEKLLLNPSKIKYEPNSRASLLS